jgi:Na+/proline symporter
MTVFAFMNHLPTVLSVMVYLGLLAASMATTSTFLVMGSYLFTRDIARSFGKVLDQKQEVVIGRWALVIVSLGALVWGLFGGNMVAILGGIGLGTFIATSLPVIVGYQWRKATREAALIAEIVTLALSIGFTLIYEGAMKRHLWAGVPGYAYIILFSVVVMVFIPFITRGAAGDLLPEKMKVYFKHME